MSLEVLLGTYGYYLLFLGTLLEGETVLVVAGFLAHRGYFSLPLVMAVAFCGSFLSDQAVFYAGRLRGRRWLAKRVAWRSKADRVFALLARHQTLLVLGFRFLYGLRTLIPFLVGLSRISPLRFFLLNGIGAIVWSIAVASLGYGLGQAAEVILGKVARYELWIVAGITVAGAGVALTARLIARTRGSR